MATTTPKFTRRDFQWLADFLREADDLQTTPTGGMGWMLNDFLAALTEDMADRLKATNPNFDRDRFMRAATPEGKEVPA